MLSGFRWRIFFAIQYLMSASPVVRYSQHTKVGVLYCKIYSIKRNIFRRCYNCWNYLLINVFFCSGCWNTFSVGKWSNSTLVGYTWWKKRQKKKQSCFIRRDINQIKPFLWELVTKFNFFFSIFCYFILPFRHIIEVNIVRLLHLVDPTVGQRPASVPNDSETQTTL